MEGINQEEINSSEAEEKLALQAKGLFIAASFLSPASGIRQAARIAKKCKKLGIRPGDMMTTLLERSDLIEEIQQIAISKHRDANVREYLSIERVEYVIWADFTMASYMTFLHDSQLREIYQTPGSLEDESIIKVTNWLEAKGRYFNYPEPFSPYDRR